MRIAEETIAKVRDANDLIEVVGEYVPNLKRAGKDYKALCPFHQERTPSFLVSPSKGIFHCFGCGSGGDLFKFVMEMEHCSYPEAILKLADRKGIPVERSSGAAPFAQGREKKKALFQILERAAQFFHKALLESREGEAALRYLTEKRRLSLETIRKFRLGWAPASGSALAQNAIKAGCAESELVRAGLILRSRRDGRWMDWFRGRVMFPIVDVKGQVIAFGGRILESPAAGSENPPPKYLNSAETEIFQKGRNLFGFHQAQRALREKNEALLVEGYMDVIACHQAGVEQAVAPLGTAFTPDQAQVLRRFVERITLLFDSDRAGESATIRGAEVLLEKGFLPMVAALAGAKDADEFLAAHSREEFELEIARRRSVVEFRLDAALARTGDSLDAKVNAIRSVFPLLAKVEDEISRSELLKQVAERTRVSQESLVLEWNKFLKKGAPSVRGRSAAPGPVRKAGAAEAPPARRPSGFLSAEEELICLGMMVPPLREKLLQVLDDNPEVFAGEEFRECRAALGSQEPWTAVGDFLARLSAPTAQWLSSILVRLEMLEVTSAPEPIFESLVRRVEQKARAERLKRLGPAAAKAINQGGAITPDVLEYQRIAPALKGRNQK